MTIRRKRRYSVLRVRPQVRETAQQSPGGDNEEATPVPIPNTVVKLFGADDTWLATARENRELPGHMPP